MSFRTKRTVIGLLVLGLSLVSSLGASRFAYGQTPSLDERLERLEKAQQEMDRQLQEKDARIRELESKLAEAASSDSKGITETTITAAPYTPAPANVDLSKSMIDTSSPMAAGAGFDLVNSEAGKVNLGMYALVRASEQRQEGSDRFEDHLGRVRNVDPRRDFQLHRVMVHLRGWAYDPKFSWALTGWTVNDTEQVRIIGNMGYQFNEGIKLSAGIGPNNGTRSMGGSHPLWQGHDRDMADEYFRPGFTFGTWVDGLIADQLGYRVMVANQISTLGVTATEDTRDLAYSGSLWWMPTTGEFGPQGGYRDFEWHEELATRFGASYVRSPKEDRAAQPSQSAPDTTQIRLGDSLLLFETGALADGATVQRANVEIMSVDAGFKYKGIFLQAEGFRRFIDSMKLTDASTTPLPVTEIEDWGFYVKSAFFPIPKKLELYASTSWIYPDEDAGYDDSHEWIVGANWFWTGTPYQRVNLQVINVTDSPASSSFGYYTGGMDGTTITLDVSFVF